MSQETLPALSPRLLSATLSAADYLAAVARAEGIELVGKRGQSRPRLITLLTVIRDRMARPGVGPDHTITPAEIAAALATIGQVMVSEGMEELAGRQASWFRDAAAVVDTMAVERRS